MVNFAFNFKTLKVCIHLIVCRYYVSWNMHVVFHNKVVCVCGAEPSADWCTKPPQREGVGSRNWNLLCTTTTTVHSCYTSVCGVMQYKRPGQPPCIGCFQLDRII